MYSSHPACVVAVAPIHPPHTSQHALSRQSQWHLSQVFVTNGLNDVEPELYGTGSPIFECHEAAVWSEGPWLDAGRYTAVTCSIISFLTKV